MAETTKRMPKEVYARLKELVGQENFGDTIRGSELRTILDKYCEYLGSGCARVAYKCQVEDYEPSVLKWRLYVPESDPHRESACISSAKQMSGELHAMLLHAGHEHVPRLFDWDEEGMRWLEMEYLAPLPSEDIDAYYWRIGFYSSAELGELAEALGLAESELRRIDHWGIDANGRRKIIDMGLQAN